MIAWLFMGLDGIQRMWDGWFLKEFGCVGFSRIGFDDIKMVKEQQASYLFRLRGKNLRLMFLILR